MALKSASDGTEHKRIEWLPENKLLCLRRRSRSLEPTSTQLASLPTAPPLIERVYYTAGCWWALHGPASVLPVLASKPSSQAQGLASGAGSHRRCSRSARLRLPLLSSQTEFGFELVKPTWELQGAGKRAAAAARTRAEPRGEAQRPCSPAGNVRPAMAS